MRLCVGIISWPDYLLVNVWVLECQGMQVLVQQPHTRSPPRNLLSSEYYTWQASVYHLLGGFISWNQICAFFSVNQCKWEYFNGYPKRRDLAEHVILLLPMCMRCNFIVTSHFHTWNLQMYHITHALAVCLIHIATIYTFVKHKNQRASLYPSGWKINHPLG